MDTQERGRDHMQAHTDFGLLSINIALNDGYDGGGTWFQALGGDGGQIIEALGCTPWPSALA